MNFFSTQKIKLLVTAKEPMRCKLAVNDQIIDLVSKYHAIDIKKVMTFKYQDLVDKVKDQD